MIKTAIGVGCLLLALMSVAHAKLVGEVTNGEATPDRYSFGCISNVDGASVYTAPDLNKPFVEHGGSVASSKARKGTDMRVDRIIDVDGPQFLSGQILNISRGRVSSWEKAESDVQPGEESDRFYVLSKEWDCTLRKEGVAQNTDRKRLVDGLARAISDLDLCKEKLTQCGQKTGE